MPIHSPNIPPFPTALVDEALAATQAVLDPGISDGALYPVLRDAWRVWKAANEALLLPKGLLYAYRPTDDDQFIYPPGAKHEPVSAQAPADKLAVAKRLTIPLLSYTEVTSGTEPRWQLELVEPAPPPPQSPAFPFRQQTRISRLLIGIPPATVSEAAISGRLYVASQVALIAVPGLIIPADFLRLKPGW